MSSSSLLLLLLLFVGCCSGCWLLVVVLVAGCWLGKDWGDLEVPPKTSSMGCSPFFRFVVFSFALNFLHVNIMCSFVFLLLLLLLLLLAMSRICWQRNTSAARKVYSELGALFLHATEPRYGTLCTHLFVPRGLRISSSTTTAMSSMRLQCLI